MEEGTTDTGAFLMYKKEGVAFFLHILSFLHGLLA